MVKRIFLWIAVILTSIMIFSFSADNGADSENISEKVTDKVIEFSENINNKETIVTEETYLEIHKVVRKIGHIVEFALLGALTFLLAKSYNLSLKMSVFISLTYCSLFAVSDELHQLFVDGRDGSILDVMIDFFGSVLGVGVFWVKGKIKQQKNTK